MSSSIVTIPWLNHVSPHAVSHELHSCEHDAPSSETATLSLLVCQRMLKKSPDLEVSRPRSTKAELCLAIAVLWKRETIAPGHPL